MIGLSATNPSTNYKVVALRGDGTRIVNISLFANVEEIEADKWYKVEWYTLQIISDKSESEIALEVEADWDGYLALAKQQMQGEVEELKNKDLENKVALAQIFELVVAN